MYEFEFRTGKVTIDYDKCAKCTSYACIKACSLYGRGILRLQKGKPVLAVPPEEVKKGQCIEDLSCEQDCQFYGAKGLRITLPIEGLDKFREKYKGKGD
jgi:NAD-dependent dihydropyrimidine dehydrogenase PreA subunit